MPKDNKNKAPTKGASGKEFWNSQPKGDVKAAAIDVVTHTLAAVSGAYAASAVGKWVSLALGLGSIGAGQFYDIPLLKSAGVGMLVGGTFDATNGTFMENAKANTNQKMQELKDRVMPTAATGNNQNSNLKGVNSRINGLHGTGGFTRHSVSQQVLPPQQAAYRSVPASNSSTQTNAEVVTIGGYQFMVLPNGKYQAL